MLTYKQTTNVSVQLLRKDLRIFLYCEIFQSDKWTKVDNFFHLHHFQQTTGKQDIVKHQVSRYGLAVAYGREGEWSRVPCAL